MKKVILVIAVLMSVNCAFPQYIIIHKNVESSLHSKVSEIDSITFCPETVSYEGKVYNVVVVGDQCWLKENLDVGTRIDGSTNQSNNSQIEKYCFNNDPANCEAEGGLYQWDEAMQYITTEGTQGICPDGWHIPTLSEFETLAVVVDDSSNALKAIGEGIGDGIGTNTSGFTAFLSGFWLDVASAFANYDISAFFWSSSQSSFWSSTMLLSRTNNGIALYGENRGNGASVRCIMD